tara:strand:+ start:220 stop:471 length:252 start_codon:yes stop_codon:yes gene_type:complete
MERSPKQFVKNNATEDSPVLSKTKELGIDDDDPLSIKEISFTVIGILIALLTFILPAISVLLERPTVHKNGVKTNLILKKDGY